MYVDVARFTPRDPDALVAASLVCPMCLRDDGVVCEDSLEGYDPLISCECSGCDVTWRVYLTPEQALRLGLMHARTR